MDLKFLLLDTQKQRQTSSVMKEVSSEIFIPQYEAKIPKFQELVALMDKLLLFLKTICDHILR